MWYSSDILPQISLIHLAMIFNNTIITCSETAKKQYEKKYGLKKVKITHHAVDVSRFSSQTKKKTGKRFVLGEAGRLAPSKNFETFIKAAIKADSPKPLKLSLVFARETEDKDYQTKIKALLNQAQKAGLAVEIFHNLPFEKIADYYQQLDLYVHPVITRSVGKVALEAIVSGVPVLLSQNGNRDLAKDCPEILFDPQDSEKLAQKISWALHHYHTFSQRQKAFQKKVREEFSTQKLMKRLVKLYEN